MSEVVIKHFEDLGFSVSAAPSEYRVEFFIYEIIGVQPDGALLWQKAGSENRPDPVDKIEDAGTYFIGNVKWDGCSNWDFDQYDGTCLHFCGRADFGKISQVMERCYDWTKELLPSWSDFAAA